MKQKLIPFGEAAPPAKPREKPTRYEPSDEALAAFEHLEAWLINPKTHRCETALAEQAIRFTARALLEGKSGYFHVAEDALETLKLRNAKTEGDDIPPGAGSDRDFHQTIEDILDQLHEIMLTTARSR